MVLKMVLPKGRQMEKVAALLSDIGIQLQGTERNYRPACNDPDLQIKLLKSQNIPPLVALGQHDLGFAGLDWIREQGSDVVEVMDLGFDPVRIVVCIPEDWNWEEVRRRKLIAVSEYRNLCEAFLRERGLAYDFVQSFGATEVFPPEDADLIVDNTSTGVTLQENRLKIVETLMKSTTRLIANRAAMADPWKRERIDELALLIRAVLAGRERVLLEMNCSAADLTRVVELLPSMKAPTIAKLYEQDGFALKSVVPRTEVRSLIPQLLRAGASDILETQIRKVIP